MVMMKKFITLSIFIGSFAMATASSHKVSFNDFSEDTQQSEEYRSGRMPPKPPREIFEKMLKACRGKSEGDDCEVNVIDPEGNAVTIEASCQIDEELNRLFCALPPPPRR